MATAGLKQSLAAGKKIYRGSSDSANRGQTLDPSGYINRSMLQRAARTRMAGGGMGPGGSLDAAGVKRSASTARSGLAQTALAGQRGEQDAPTPPNPNVGGLAPMNMASGQSQFGTGINPNLSQVKSFNTAGPNLQGQAPQFKLPGIPTSITGQLSSKLDADYKMQQAQGYDSLNSTIANLQNALAKLGTEYQSTLRDANTEGQKDYADLASQYAAMGGGPGTGYGQAYQELTTDHANFLNDLNTWLNQGQQDIGTDKNSAQTAFATLLKGLKGLQGDRDAKEKAAAALKAAAAKAAAAKVKAASKAKSYSSSRPKPRVVSGSTMAKRSSNYKAPAKKKSTKKPNFNPKAQYNRSTSAPKPKAKPNFNPKAVYNRRVG